MWLVHNQLKSREKCAFSETLHAWDFGRWDCVAFGAECAVRKAGRPGLGGVCGNPPPTLRGYTNNHLRLLQ